MGNDPDRPHTEPRRFLYFDVSWSYSPTGRLRRRRGRRRLRNEKLRDRCHFNFSKAGLRLSTLGAFRLQDPAFTGSPLLLPPPSDLNRNPDPGRHGPFRTRRAGAGTGVMWRERRKQQPQTLTPILTAVVTCRVRPRKRVIRDGSTSGTPPLLTSHSRSDLSRSPSARERGLVS